MKKTLIAGLALLIALAAAPSPAAAQSKGETKLYTKTMAKPSLKSYAKFLKKYPDSVYASEILTLRDSTLFAAVDRSDVEAVYKFAEEYKSSPIIDEVWDVIDVLETPGLDAAQARKLLEDALGGDVRTLAVPYRHFGKDWVVGVAVNAPDKSFGNVRIYRLNFADGSLASTDYPKYYNDPKMDSTEFYGDVRLERMGRRTLIGFDYLNTSKATDVAEYVTSLYDIDNDLLYNAMFYGRNLPSKNAKLRIEGQSPEILSGGMLTAEQALLNNRLSGIDVLVPITKADALSDESISWWLGKNPKAETTARSVTFGVLDGESSLVSEYRKKAKESSGGYSAALFDFRGYTVIVSRSSSSGEYSLVWCEPICKNKNRDKLLNSIYFEKGATLVLFYYKGKTTFKYRLSLASKSLTR